eukprot:TRINITY_DN4202_c0_g1_i6.p1 TRINITY_DN4202_c0_g1~~TRINITY_DN4202_c0_g1_i6.p1  ORF type:complete len:325 (-),score=44.60 TRINITY_DN4202_c0_g1_i6:133-1107(-)
MHSEEGQKQFQVERLCVHNSGRQRQNQISYLDGSVRRKIFSTKHKIRGKNVDIKLAEADKKKMDQLNANKKVFVGGLDSSVDASNSFLQKIDYLKKYFEKFGGVQDAIVLRDVNTNQSRGFGFVTFDSEEIADNCVQENNFEIRGKRVDIKKADPKQASQKQSRYASSRQLINSTYPIPSDDPLFPDPLKIPYPFFPFPGSFDPSLVPNPEMMNPSKLEGMIPPPFPLQFPLPGMPEVPGAGEEGKRPEGERGKCKVLSVDNHVGPIRDFKGKESTYAPYQVKKISLLSSIQYIPVSYTHLRAHETSLHLVCRLLLEKKKKKKR